MALWKMISDVLNDSC